MENFLGSFEFTFLGVYYFFIGIIFSIFFGYEKLKKEGWDKVHVFLKESAINYVRWGKNQEVLLLFKKIQQYLFFGLIIDFF